jgi:hypothetical protein
MKKKDKIKEVALLLSESKVYKTPTSIYAKSKLKDKFSYKTFWRICIEFLKQGVLDAWNISLGKGKGRTFVITYINKEELKKY